MDERQIRGMKLHRTLAKLLRGVEIVSQNRVPHCSEVDPDLVGSAGFEAAGDEGSVSEIGDVFDVSHRWLSVHVHRHLLAVGLVPCHRGVDGEFIAINVSGNDGEVATLGGLLFDLGGEGDVGGVGFGDDHKSGGFSVEAMDDSGSEITTDFGEGATSA